jgi:YfiH family protein
MKTRPIPYRTIEYTEGEHIPYLHFPMLDNTGIVSHLFTTRLGGVSEGIFATMNLSSNRGDDKTKVLENYRRVAMQLGCEEKDFCFSDQTHTTNIRVITEDDRGKGMVRPQDYKDIDGIITNVPGIALGTFYADCVPLYFVDPVHRAIGLSHSGWRGTVGRMGEVTVREMSRTYGSDAKDLLCAIGPSICVSCYEVSTDVADEFIRAFDIKNTPAWDGQGNDFDTILWKKENDKWQLNLWAANVRVLRDAGVRPENISVSNVCSACNPDLLFSHRVTKGKRGNCGAFMMLKP